MHDHDTRHVQLSSSCSYFFSFESSRSREISQGVHVKFEVQSQAGPGTPIICLVIISFSRGFNGDPSPGFLNLILANFTYLLFGLWSCQNVKLERL